MAFYRPTRSHRQNMSPLLSDLEDGDLRTVLVLIGNIRKHFKVSSSQQCYRYQTLALFVQVVNIYHFMTKNSNYPLIDMCNQIDSLKYSLIK